jgi:hypothetical protein
MSSSFNWKDKWQCVGLYSHVIEHLAHLCSSVVNESIHFGLCKHWLSWELALTMRFIPSCINKFGCGVSWALCCKGVWILGDLCSMLVTSHHLTRISLVSKFLFFNSFHFISLDTVILCLELEDFIFLFGYINFDNGFDFGYGNSECFIFAPVYNLGSELVGCLWLLVVWLFSDLWFNHLWEWD